MPTVDELRAQVDALGIVDVPPEILEKAIALAKKIGRLEEFLLAEGQQGTPSEDGSIDWLVSPEDKVSVGEVKKGDRIDFRERQVFVQVKAQQIIARWHPPVEGTPGRDVRGKAIPVRAPRDNRFVVGRNVELQNNETEARALSNGHLLMSGRQLTVDQLHRVSTNVDYATGNIRFPGNVEIAKDVAPGFVVHADGDILIRGTVEDAEIRAAGDIVIMGGVLNNARIVAGGSVQLKFAQGSYIECEDELQVADSLVQCNVGKCAVFRLTNHNGHRGVAGGKLLAKELVQTQCLGSEIEVRTDVVLGVDPDHVLKEKRLMGLIAHNQSDAERIEHFIAMGLAHGKTQEDEGIKKLMLALHNRRRSAEQAQDDLRKLEHDQLDPGRSRVEAFGTVFGGVHFTFGKAQWRVQNSMEHVQFWYDREDREVRVMKMPDGKATDKKAKPKS